MYINKGKPLETAMYINNGKPLETAMYINKGKPLKKMRHPSRAEKPFTIHEGLQPLAVCLCPCRASNQSVNSNHSPEGAKYISGG